MPTIIFLDEGNNSSTTATNRLQITATLSGSQEDGTKFREFGLFGGDGDRQCQHRRDD